MSSILDHLLRVSEGKADMATRQAAVMQLVAEELLKHKEQGMLTAEMRLPPYAPKTRTVWIGIYGGNYDIVVVFTKRPRKGKKGAWNEGEYTASENETAAIIGLQDFNDWFGTSLKAEGNSIRSVFPCRLTAIWDQHGRIYGLNTNAD